MRGRGGGKREEGAEGGKEEGAEGGKEDTHHFPPHSINMADVGMGATSTPCVPLFIRGASVIRLSIPRTASTISAAVTAAMPPFLSGTESVMQRVLCDQGTDTKNCCSWSLSSMVPSLSSPFSFLSSLFSSLSSFACPPSHPCASRFLSSLVTSSCEDCGLFHWLIVESALARERGCHPVKGSEEAKVKRMRMEKRVLT